MPRFLLRDLKGLGFILLVVYGAGGRDLLPRPVWITLSVPGAVAMVAAGLWLIWMGLRARPEQWTGTWPLEDGVVTGHRVVQGFGLGWWLNGNSSARVAVTLTLPGGRVAEVQPRTLNAVRVSRPQPRPPLRDLDDQGDRAALLAAQALVPVGTPLTVRVHPGGKPDRRGLLEARLDVPPYRFWMRWLLGAFGAALSVGTAYLMFSAITR
ncbi:hypothetical protein GCM10008956_35300 [Deinococcus arenae]|uniref:Uncharacterized protein n=1 Tax=Deinococcus arenae TaxID=1452751 RepID=A0A8H9L7Q8_9DEIO|nr:hypothetical protein [Deinococcus arenae]AWT34161.1 hypothetical protein DM785_00260 [Deinococcus actinosclerus]GGM56356.1 hypothetical protein GCM10008956_35300 [Deinococcus arenae]